MTLVPTDESKDTLKKNEELWNKIRDLIRSKTNNSDSYNEKCMKVKFNSDDILTSKENAWITWHGNSYNCFSWGQQMLPTSFFIWTFL